MKRFHPRATLLAVSLLSILSGCQDDNQSPSPSMSLEVTAIDGYLRHAAVWLDVNRNGQQDPEEPSAETGEGGKAVIDLTGFEGMQHSFR